MEITITIKIDDCDLVNSKRKEELTGTKSTECPSVYARFFDETSPQWIKDSEYNLRFLRMQERYANDILKRRGYIFLNEVYDILGISRTKAGALIGWVYDEKNPVGDNFVDFGIFKSYNSEFVNGLSRCALLDFNVDGIILDKLKD